jgi:hypothetical protein
VRKIKNIANIVVGGHLGFWASAILNIKNKISRKQQYEHTLACVQI